MNSSVLLYSLIYLCAFICGCPDDDEIANLYYEVPDLVKVENNNHQYQINDTIVVEVKIPRNISISENENINIYQLSGRTEKAFSSLAFFKFDEFNTPQPILLSIGEVITFDNEVSISNNFLGLTNVLINDFYQAKVGIILRESGSFYIEGLASPTNNNVQISLQTTNNPILFINSTIIDDNNENQFSFTVE